MSTVVADVQWRRGRGNSPGIWRPSTTLLPSASVSACRPVPSIDGNQKCQRSKLFHQLQCSISGGAVPHNRWPMAVRFRGWMGDMLGNWYNADGSCRRPPNGENCQRDLVWDFGLQLGGWLAGLVTGWFSYWIGLPVMQYQMAVMSASAAS